MLFSTFFHFLLGKLALKRCFRFAIYKLISSQICNVVSVGNFCGKSATVSSSTFGGGDADKKTSRDINFRKPVGVAALEITDLFTFKQGKATQVILLTIVPSLSIFLDPVTKYDYIVELYL